MTDKVVAGVDISKEWLDIAIGAAIERIANNADAIVSWLNRVEPWLVAFEPTGGL